ncbi:MAG: hypothetical protein RIS29_826 [Bacteroidota bacterium]|jgi:hypothetical protein
MNSKRFKLFLICIFALSIVRATAQNYNKDEYKAEIGAIGGINYYIGDANQQLFKYNQPTFGGLFRYRFDKRLALRTELTMATVAAAGIKSNMVFAGDICGEFNFFDLEQNPYKKYSKTYSPYIFGGLTLMTDVYDQQALPVAGIAFGVGLKVKLNKRLNLNIQWSNRQMFADNLEGTSKSGTTSDPLNNYQGLNGSNILNNDLLSSFTVGITWDFWKKQCDCMNTNYKKRR